MPIRPPPFTLTCPSCGWSKTFAPQSDALMPSDLDGLGDVCPKCKHSPLKISAGQGVFGAFGRWSRLIKQALG